MKDKSYWENYYKNLNLPVEPSFFAKYIRRKFAKKGCKIIELGCGNGRDAFYFATTGCNVIAYDQCVCEIARLNTTNKNSSLFFKAEDFTKIKTPLSADLIYSRFTLHAINERSEDMLMKWLPTVLKTKGLFCVEARGLKNEICGLGKAVDKEESAFIFNNHYRRFIDKEKLCQKLNDIGFKILFCAERKGYAPYQGENQTFFRVIAENAHDKENKNV